MNIIQNYNTYFNTGIYFLIEDIIRETSEITKLIVVN